MKKLLIASTALSLAGGAAFAEMAFTLSGDAKMGVDYNSEATGGKSKHEFKHEIGVDFTGSGTTDAGLSFGASAGFDVSDKAINTGTVHVSGSFGTLTIGGNDAADLTAGGTNDVGLFDIGVDDKAEGLRGGTAAQLRYDNSFGQIKIAISAGTEDGSPMKMGDSSVKGTYFYTVPGDVDKVSIGGGFSAYHPDERADDYTGPPIDRGLYQTRALQLVNAGIGDATVAVNAAGDGIVFDPDGAGPGTTFVDLHGIRRGQTGSNGTQGADLSDEDKDGFYTAGGTGAVTISEEAAAAFAELEKLYGLGDDGALNVAANTISDMPNADEVALIEGMKATPDTPAVKSETQYAFGMSFEAGGVTIGVGYDSNKTVSMGAGFTAGEISTNLLYVKTDEEHDDGEMTGIGADMAYSMGASTVTLSYGRRKPEMGEAMDAVGMGVTHDLGGNATMSAGFGKVDESNKASIGLSFKF